LVGSRLFSIVSGLLRHVKLPLLFTVRLTMKSFWKVAVVALGAGGCCNAIAQDLGAEVAELRQLLAEAKSDYEARIAGLEKRLEQAERVANDASRDAGDAREVAEQAAIDSTSGSTSANAFNPAISAVLIGRYGDIGNGWDSIPGFIPGGEIGPGESGFSLGESEFNLNANIDPLFFGNLTLAIADDGGVTELSAEEAWIQTTSLPHGLTLRGGRYFSNVGYLNGVHAHADDFADRPLPYQAFLGGQYKADGVQMTWLAPTAMFLELGAELNWGGGFPMTGNGDTSPDAWTMSGKLGGDVGDSHSWQAGLAYISTDVVERTAGNGDSFSGDSDLAVFDFIWKWSPGGNPTIHNFKVQGEYLRREENGEFAMLPYDGKQNGWYLQGAWQFRQGWRVGARWDQLDSNNGPLFAGTILQDPAWTPRRASLMFDWSPSEFSRLRLQYTNDRVQDAADNQFILQYLMSLGAHGAHRF
jgi:hypothetical protein